MGFGAPRTGRDIGFPSGSRGAGASELLPSGVRVAPILALGPRFSARPACGHCQAERASFVTGAAARTWRGSPPLMRFCSLQRSLAAWAIVQGGRPLDDPASALLNRIHPTLACGRTALAVLCLRDARATCGPDRRRRPLQVIRRRILCLRCSVPGQRAAARPGRKSGCSSAGAPGIFSLRSFSPVGRSWPPHRLPPAHMPFFRGSLAGSSVRFFVPRGFPPLRDDPAASASGLVPSTSRAVRARSPAIAQGRRSRRPILPWVCSSLRFQDAAGILGRRLSSCHPEEVGECKSRACRMRHHSPAATSGGHPLMGFGSADASEEIGMQSGESCPSAY